MSQSVPMDEAAALVSPEAHVWDFTKLLWRLELLADQKLGWATSANGDSWQPQNVPEHEIVRVSKTRDAFLYTSSSQIAGLAPFTVVTISSVTPYASGESPEARHATRGPGFWWRFPPFARGAGSRKSPWVFEIRDSSGAVWQFCTANKLWDPKMIVDPL